MKLLREISSLGPPRDYLYARVRCRRAALDLSGRGSWSGSGDPHKALRAEYVWVYGQLEEKLRRQLLPLFEYFELRTLVVALRYLAAGDRAAMAAQLQHSLLAPQLLKQLSAVEKVAVAIAGLERLLGEDYTYCQSMSEIYLRQGPGGLEQQLLGGGLQDGISRSRAGSIRELLQYLLDMRNLLAVHKHLRWQIPTAPPLLTGGELDVAHYKKISASGDMPALQVLISRRAGLKLPAGTDDLENFLLRGLSQRLHRAGRDPLQLGLLLDYLWRCQQVARKRGLRLAGVDAAEVPLTEVAG